MFIEMQPPPESTPTNKPNASAVTPQPAISESLISPQKAVEENASAPESEQAVASGGQTTDTESTDEGQGYNKVC